MNLKADMVIGNAINAYVMLLTMKFLLITA